MSGLTDRLRRQELLGHPSDAGPLLIEAATTLEALAAVVGVMIGDHEAGWRYVPSDRLKKARAALKMLESSASSPSEVA